MDHQRLVEAPISLVLMPIDETIRNAGRAGELDEPLRQPEHQVRTEDLLRYVEDFRLAHQFAHPGEYQVRLLIDEGLLLPGGRLESRVEAFPIVEVTGATLECGRLVDHLEGKENPAPVVGRCGVT
jgi:hypothetical protein